MGLGSAGGGIQVAPLSGGTAVVVLDRVRLDNNGTALSLQSSGGEIAAEVIDSVVTGSSVNGILALAGNPAVSLTITNSKLFYNVGAAVQANGSNATVSIDSSTITLNQFGVSRVSNGVLRSFQNNKIFGNTTDGTPIPAIGLQ